MDQFLSFLGLFVVFCLILFLAYLTSRFVGKRYGGQKKNRIMKIVETLPMGIDRNLVLVHIGTKYYLLSSTRSKMEFLTGVDIGDFVEDPTEKESFDFQSIISKYTGLADRSNRYMKARNEKTDTTDVTDGEGLEDDIERSNGNSDEFAEKQTTGSSVRSSIDRLRKITKG
jgi:flagellar protein FliO/FliZ